MRKAMIIIYHHRHGTDLVPVFVDDVENLPTIDNLLLRDLGVSDPELERDDEWAEWRQVGPVEEWKVLTVPETKRPRYRVQ